MFELPTIDYPVDEIDDSPRPPDGLRLRPYAGEADIRLIVDIANRALEADGVPFRDTVRGATAWFSNPNDKFDAARDVTIAEIDGQAVGYGQRSWIDTTMEELREYRSDGAVVPEWRRRGIGTAILAHNIERARALARTQETERTRVLGSWTSDRMVGAHALLRSSGFEPVRWFFEMTRDLGEPIPEVALPDGLEVRPVTSDQLRQIWDADVEAFIDHWGGFDGSDENYRRFLERPSFDPTLWVIAWDGDEVAGGVVNGINRDENELLGANRGWLNSVFARRAWRKRGLANALICRSLALIKDRGMDTGILGVDADNPNGALGLYERNGFVVAEKIDGLAAAARSHRPRCDIVKELAKWGWGKREEALLQPFSARGLSAARVLAEHRGSYAIATEAGEADASVSGRFRFDASVAEDFPAVGDWVAVELIDGSQSAVIQAVLPRSTRFVRPARGPIPEAQVVAANVDLVLLVTGLDHDFNLRRLERYLALAWSSGAEPVIVLNKADLCDDLAGRLADVSMVAPGVPVRVLSALEGTGIESLTPLLEPGRTIALLGSSGVGKSTIVNALLGYERQATGAVREDDQRGRHTTTTRELLVLPNGALLIDSPGIRSVGMWDIDEGLSDAFADLEAFAASCRFRDCMHGSEPGCAVQAAISNGELAAARLHSQQKLQREWAAVARRVDHGARELERRRWKSIHKSVRNHMKLKYGSEA